MFQYQKRPIGSEGGVLMNVRFFPAKKGNRSSLIAGFLRQNQVQHELIQPDAILRPRHLHRLGEVPIVEVDGHVFINPNDQALKKILNIDYPIPE